MYDEGQVTKTALIALGIGLLVGFVLGGKALHDHWQQKCVDQGCAKWTVSDRGKADWEWAHPDTAAEMERE